MDRKHLAIVAGIFSLVIISAAAAPRLSAQSGSKGQMPEWSHLDTSAAEEAGPEAVVREISYDGYARTLKSFVNDRGMVDYQGIKKHRKLLDSFVASMATLDPEAVDKWPEKEKIAVWLNAYNALTLTAIIDNYPIQSSFTRSLVFPKNSIRQIPGVWTELKWTVAKQPMTLDHIEHKILRVKFNEPRIHMALVCAAMGCPPLRNEPYYGRRLDQQLDDQTRKFLANPKKFRIDREQNRVYLSPIFDWFWEDFKKFYPADDQAFLGNAQTERAVLNFIGRYLSVGDRKYLIKADYEVVYLDYDWSLNEQ